MVYEYPILKYPMGMATDINYGPYLAGIRGQIGQNTHISMFSVKCLSVPRDLGTT
jgi:hypothetical protein